MRTSSRPPVERAVPPARASARPAVTSAQDRTLPGAADAAPAIAPWRALAHLTERLLTAGSRSEICFILANETWHLMPFRQAVLWRIDSRDRPRLHTVSGLPRLAEDSPNTVFLKRLGRYLHRRNPRLVTAADLPRELAAEWRDFMPPCAYVLPVTAGDDRRKLAILAFALEAPPDATAQELAQRAVAVGGRAWSRIGGGVATGRASARRWRIAGWLAVAAAVLALLVPVRLSVLAPAEVIALDAMAVSVPIDGVVASFAVAPNQVVARGDLLFTLDDTTLRNRRIVAQRQLQVARADALAAAQKAFASEASRAELAGLEGRVAERRAELDWIEEQLARVEVRAPADGIVVFGDVNDWIGKPLVTGERVALLADPADAGVLIWLPVADALEIEAGAPVRLFLHVAPLEPLAATLSQTSYQSVLSPDGVSSYRLRARFDPLDDAGRRLARIGLRGTARIQAGEAPLGYYLLRRPIAAVREWTGW
ncbi:MAG: HlyD family efflux transporter periplasmic adaptor subunit [Burkholderiaceae bacterium]|nr:HlyD family efflux transporter periplasmic adaptor subunit [Burkholderiaceae bacterium]